MLNRFQLEEIIHYPLKNYPLNDLYQFNIKHQFLSG
jgi:hypothetical protein